MHASIRQHLDQLVYEIVVSFRQQVERLGEQSDLLVPFDQGDQDDEPAMDIKLRILLEKIAAIVGDDDVVVGDGERDQIPVLPSGFPDVRHMVGLKAAGLCDGHQT